MPGGAVLGPARAIRHGQGWLVGTDFIHDDELKHLDPLTALGDHMTNTIDELDDEAADVRNTLTNQQETPVPDHITNTQGFMPTHQTWSMTEAAELLDHIPVDLLRRMSDQDRQNACADRVAELVRNQLHFNRRRNILLASVGAIDPNPPSLLESSVEPGHEYMATVTGETES